MKTPCTMYPGQSVSLFDSDSVCEVLCFFCQQERPSPQASQPVQPSQLVLIGRTSHVSLSFSLDEGRSRRRTRSIFLKLSTTNKSAPSLPDRHIRCSTHVMGSYEEVKPKRSVHLSGDTSAFSSNRDVGLLRFDMWDTQCQPFHNRH